MNEKQLAVLIDVENVGLTSIRALFDQISDLGRVIVKRAYADWSRALNQRDQLLELGIEPIHVFHMAKSGKNASDLRMAIDAVDLLYQSPVDTFVIVSTDSDFAPLVGRLRAAGKVVIGAGPRATAPHTLVIACDRFIYLSHDEKPEQVTPRQEQQSVESLLVRALKASMDEQGRVSGSRLHQTMHRLDPGFDYRAYGHSTFTRFLEASAEVKVLRRRGPGDLAVELKDPVAIPTGEASDPNGWDQRIDSAWRNRVPMEGGYISGPAAAALAASELGAPKLSASRYKTLQSLFNTSALIQSRWRRDGTRIVRL